MKNSYKYFENRDCQYFDTCHGGGEKNCLFCYCPMYAYEDCLGSPVFIELGIKDCTNCFFPHIPENYDRIMAFLTDKILQKGNIPK